MIPTHPVERFLALLAEAICMVVTFLIWRSVSAFQPMWPLPGLYLIEMVVLSVLATLPFARGAQTSTGITWAATGIFLAFCMLGAFSVGFLYLPTALIFAVIAVTSTLRTRQSMGRYLAVCLLAGLAQAIVMLIAIRLI
jgi:hypothetical protein